ncbi:MAG: glycosyl transferase [Rhodobacteraceae bacterium]|nr:glycosyl transferase [Paracoccaceae bacterium]
MARIAYILLCHKDPKAIVAQALRLSAGGDCVAIHFDANAPTPMHEEIASAIADFPDVVLAKKREKCGWGEWSLVRASLNAVEAAVEAFPDASHFYMLSGDCMPIKTADYAHGVLDADDVDYIESFDFFDSDWIKTGMKEDRLIYRHYFNERGRKWLFYQSLNLQRRFGLQRANPDDLQIMIGSQWWCLRRATIEAILEFIRDRPDVIRFFRTTWIPDETFFQTLVRHLVPEAQIRSRSLTFLMFSDYGMPVTFYNDHYDLLLAQDFLFARKISPEASDLKAKLGALYVAHDVQFEISGEGRNLFRFMTSRGRIGRRFSGRFWEVESSLGRDRELMIVSCKKWHVGKRLAEAVRNHTGIPTVDYLFDEEQTAMPELGGIETTMTKRARHRRALIRLLYDRFDTSRLLICMDSANLDVFRDLFSDRCATRLLELNCDFPDDYLLGHARRIGLAGDQTPEHVVQAVIPALREQIRHESEALHDQEFAGVFRMAEHGDLHANTTALAAFLTIDKDTARRIAQTPHLFAD